jgi:lysophospholipase L1-like esterase
LVALLSLVAFNTPVRNTFINLALLLGSLILFFGGIELALRITGLQRTAPNPPLIYQVSANPQISYELQPNIRKKAFKATVTTNSAGFRSPEIDESKPLIAILGDSVAFGYGVEDSEVLGAQMQQLLPQWSVLSAAVPGYNLTQEVATYREKIAPLDPEVLIIVFYFNDIGGDAGFLHTDGTLRPIGWTPSLEQCQPVTEGLLGLLPGRCWLDQHSAFYKAMKKVVNLRQGKERKAQEQQAAVEDPGIGEPEEEDVQEYINKFRAFATTLPSDLRRVFVIWPDQYLHEMSRPRITQAAEDNTFSVVDLYDTFGNTMETLPWDTVHPSPKSIEQAASVITQTLE